jgi:hypothetical protein
MRIVLRTLFILMLMLMLALPVRAGECCLPGEPPFWIGLGPSGAPAPDGAVHVVLSVGAANGSGHVRLAVPTQLRLLSGPRDIDFSGTETRPYTLLFGRGLPGDFTLRASLSFRDTQGLLSNSEVDLPGAVRGGVITFHPSRVVREERIVNGHRQRYGGSYMVPLSDHEVPVTEDALFANGRRPKVLNRIDPQCAACPKGAWPDSLQWVVFTDEQGAVRECEPIQTEPADSLRVAAMRKVLRRWTFVPAELDGRTVSDWTVVRLSIVRW